MLGWNGIDRSMKMRETSRATDKKLSVNNNPKSYLIKNLAKVMNVPYASADANTLTEAG